MALSWLWYLWDTPQGRIGREYLFFAVPALICVVLAAIALALARMSKRETTTSTPVPPDPVAVAQRLRRLRMLTMAVAALVAAVYTIIFAVRSGSLWTPVLVGCIMLAVTWTIVVIAFRRAQRREPPVS
jgi:hypothetical protein